MVLTVPRSPRNQRRNQRRALITGLTAGTFRGLSVPEELARPAPRDHASLSARVARVSGNKRAFKEIPRNTKRVILCQFATPCPQDRHPESLSRFGTFIEHAGFPSPLGPSSTHTWPRPVAAAARTVLSLGCA